jgi:multidrug efflux pump subunit AcrA (membrane-fusion protein)
VDFEPRGKPNVVHIPTSALIFREHGTEVATIRPGDKIEIKPVTLGRNLGTQVEIVEGLSLSDRVVNSPPDSSRPATRSALLASNPMPPL